MAKTIRLILACIIFIASFSSASFGWQQSFAQSEETRYFESSGHWVEGGFLEKYESVANPLRVFGYPITEAFFSEHDNLIVQYFQKARFEMPVGASEVASVSLSPIGADIYQHTGPGQPAVYPQNPANCRTFSETGKSVCYSFLDFFNANGGMAQFGLPVSGPELAGDVTVQYFERARLEWSPNLSSNEWIKVTNLGETYFRIKGEKRSLLLPVPNDNIAINIESLRVRAFPLQAVTRRSGVQTLYFIVQDQKSSPVANAQIDIVLLLPSGVQQRFIIPDLTNAQGVTQYSFQFNSPALGSARIEVYATYQGTAASTATSFRIWW